MPWLGFVPDRVVTAPPVAVARLAEQLRMDGTEIRSYGCRAQTRTDQLRLVAQYLGWRAAGALELEELDEFLLARAMEHDSPTLLFRLGCEYLISARVIRPGPVSMVERIAHAREQAQRETDDRLSHEFTPARCAELDALLAVDASLGVSRLRWLSTGPVEASAAAVRTEVEKLAFLRGLGADRLDLSVLPAERRRFLATMGRRLTPQALERRDPQRRYPILLTVLAQSGTDVLDEVVALFDQAISAKFGAAERRMQAELAERGKSGEDRQALLDDLLAIVTDPAVADEEIGALIRGEKVGWDRLRAAIAQAKPGCRVTTDIWPRWIPVRTGLTPLRRPGRLPTHQRPVGTTTRRVLPPGRAIGRPRRRPGRRGRGVAHRGRRTRGGARRRRGPGAPGRRVRGSDHLPADRRRRSGRSDRAQG